MKVKIILIVIRALGSVTKKGTGGLGNKGMSVDHPKYCIIGKSPNTEKIHTDLKRLVLTETPVKDHQLTWIWKTQEVNINDNKKNSQMSKIKRDKYMDLARELKILWIMKVTVISVGIGALDTVPKILVQGLEDLEIRKQVETSEKPSGKASAKKSQRSKITIIRLFLKID